MEDFKIVIVEDDELLGQSLKVYLEREFKSQVILYTSSETCLEKISTQINEKESFCLLVDISLGKGQNGLYLLEKMREFFPNVSAIVMTGYASIETAVMATKKGAFHYLTKPFNLASLKELIPEALKKNNIAQKSKTFNGLVGKSLVMKNLFHQMEKVSLSEKPVMFIGNAGTGRKTLAQIMHQISSRSDKAYIEVSCRSLPQTIIDNEIFGHSSESYQGRKGRLELADNGSLLIEEINYLPSYLQVKLLRFLKKGHLDLCSSQEAKVVNVRTIISTDKSLERNVKDGHFLRELYEELHFFPLLVPDLKDRKEDILDLIEHFILRFSSVDKSNQIEFSSDSLELLQQYDWPGNVRELENLIERLIILRGGHLIHPQDLPARIYQKQPSGIEAVQTLRLPSDGIDLKKILSEIEDSLIDQALKRTSGNKNQASKLLALNRTTLLEKLKKRHGDLSL